MRVYFGARILGALQNKHHRDRKLGSNRKFIAVVCGGPRVAQILPRMSQATVLRIEIHASYLYNTTYLEINLFEPRAFNLAREFVKFIYYFTTP